MTATRTPLRAVTTATSRPGASGGKLAGLTMFGSRDRRIGSISRAAIDVVAERDRIDAGGEQFMIDGRRDARAAGGVLAVGDDQVERFAFDQARQRAARRSAVPACRRYRR